MKGDELADDDDMDTMDGQPYEPHDSVAYQWDFSYQEPPGFQNEASGRQ